MRLDAWLRQGRSLADRLLLIEHLAQAVNSVHDRGEALASLSPDRIEVGNDLSCDLAAAMRGEPAAGYAAPERREGGAPTTAADIYSAGAVAWEVLVGRPCGEQPVPIADVAPDVPAELGSAVMGCLERSPQWRPRDLTYIAQLAAAHQKPLRPEPEPAASPVAARAGRPGTPRRPSQPRPPARRANRSQLPLVVAALLLVAAAAGSYWWLQRPAAVATAPPAAPVARSAAAAPAPSPSAPSPEGRAPSAPATAEPAGVTETAATPAAAPPDEPAAPETPVPTPTPTPTPELTPAPTPTPRPTPTPAPLPPPTTVPPVTEPAAAAAAPSEPVVLTALSPLSVRRPGKVLLDLRGTGLRRDLRARVLAVREAPRGISVAGQKWVSPTLVTVLLELDATVAPGSYALALEDAAGEMTKPLSFTVTK